MSTTVCSGVQFDISPRNGVNGIIPDLTTYNWDVPTLSASLTGGASNSNQPSIFGKLTNSSNVTRTAVYTVVPNVQSCESYSSFTLTVYVNPTPKISAMSTVVCSGLQFEVSPTNGGTEIVPVTTRYAWEIPAVSTASLVGGQSDSGRMSVTGILTNNTNTTRTAVYTVTPTSILGECKGATFTVLVTVNPKAVITAMSTTVCSGLTFDISPSNQLNGIVPLGTKYKWNLPLMSNVSLTGGETNSNQNSIFGTLTNATNVVRTAAYTVIPNSPLCGDNNPFTLTVFVNPKAVITAMSVVVCSGVQFSVSPRDIINGIVPAETKYSWDVPTLTPFLSGGQAASLSPTITGTLNSITNVSQTAIYIVRPRSPDCGINSSFTLTVIVNPIVVINTMTVVTCSGVPFVITPTNVTNGIIPDDTFYAWSVPTFTGTVTGGQSASNQTNISGLLTNQNNTTNTVTYTVYPSTPSCISNAPFTLIVTLHPIADIRAMSVITCSGVPFRITPTDGQNGIVPIGTKYRWSAPTVPAAIEGGAAASDQSDINGLLRNTSNAQLTATYYVTPTSVNCSDDFGFTVTVTVNPTAEITVITRAICSDVPFVISPVNSTNGIVPDGTLYTWNVPIISMSITGGASGTQQNFISGKLRNTSSVVQTATYSVEPLSGNCIGKNFTVVITLNPGGTFDPMSTTTCNGVTFEVSPKDGVNGIIPNNTKYSWDPPSYNQFIIGGESGTLRDFISGTLFNTSNVTRTVTYTITPSIPNCGFGPSFTLTVTIHPTAEIREISTTVCSGSDFTVSPTDGINGIVPALTKYRWEIPTYSGTITGGQSNTLQDRIFGKLFNRTNAQRTATYIVIPTSVNCFDDPPFTVTVFVNPTPEIVPMSTTVCSGLPFAVTPTNVTNGIVPNPTIYRWGIPTYSGTMTGGVSAENVATTISGLLLNRTNVLRTATYEVIPNAGACEGKMFTVTVFVNPTP
ncbi:MAG: PKD-like domain-containing protein, partial [Bacteroidota bacterium]